MPQTKYVGCDYPSIQSSKLKSMPKRLCCRPTPYYLKDNSVMKSLQRIREDLEREYSTRNAGQDGPRQVFSSLVNKLPNLHKTELSTLASLLTGYSKNESCNPNDMILSSLSTCRHCQSIKIYNLFFDREPENWDIERFTPTALHVACLLPSPASLVKRLVTEGAAVNHTNHLGQTPLHALILGLCLPVLPQEAKGISSLGSSEDALQFLLVKGASISIADSAGETPLLYVRNLLKEGMFQKASRVANILLQAGSDVHHHNVDGRNLLSYSIQYLDDSISLTKTLLNYGASIWGYDELGDTSAFKWLLKAIMSQRPDSTWHITLNLLSQLMCSQPQRMKALIRRTMSRHARCYKIYGPVFLNIISLVEKYWKYPSKLTSLCRIHIKESISIESHYSAVATLDLPRQIQRYLLLDDHCRS